MRFTQCLAASALAALASAQTHTDCNPMQKECPNDPAMSATFETDFTAGKDAVKGWKQTAGSLNYVDAGAEFTINKKGDAPTIQSEGYFQFGYVEVKAKAASGQGIISSIVLQSEDLDEVDWEFLGTTTTNVQMNYFGKGNTTTYDRMIEGPVSNPQQEVHSYALNWTAEALTWIIDDKPVRTLKFGDANGGNNYPQTPATIRIGIWAGGDPDNEKGVIEWAGGVTDYTKSPFTMTVQSVKVINYSPGQEYKWTDKTGSYKSIQVIGAGDQQGAPQNSAAISATATGGGLESRVNVPSVTGGEFHQQPNSTASCSEGDKQPTTTASPNNTTQRSGSGTVPEPTPEPSSAAPGTPETPCSCGIVTVTVTGNPPPASQTGEVPPPASSALPVETTSTGNIPPPVTVPAGSAPPYPTGGLITDTAPAPSVPYPTAPTGVLPPSNSSTTAQLPQFTGAASYNKASAVLGLVAGAAMLMV